MEKTTKMGFWAILSIVISSQIGSGVFVLPKTLAQYGYISILSWIIAGIGGILLALIFAHLCKKIPRTGGPHAYVQYAFGAKAAFFTAWTYWVISWISSVALVCTATDNILYIIGIYNFYLNVWLKIIITTSLTILNVYGMHASRRLDFILILLKIFPLVILPALCLLTINYEYFVIEKQENISSVSAFLSTLQAASFVTFWGFIGVETATAPAEAVNNPTKNIPRAIIIGTICVTLIYLLSNIAILGTVAPNILTNHTVAPFAEAANKVLGGQWHNATALATVIVCLSTLNTWILTSGQISLGAAHDRLFPAIFLQINKHGAPAWGIFTSSLGMIIVILCTTYSSLSKQIDFVINVSVTAFLWVYAICIISYIKILYNTQPQFHSKYIAPIMALAFCIWIMCGTDYTMLSLTLLVPLSGVPIYLYVRGKLTSQ